MIDIINNNEKIKKQILNSIGIICDTREKQGKNDHILNYFNNNDIPWKREALLSGDYTLYIPKNESLGIIEDINFANQIMIERKRNLEEISGNIVEIRKKGEKPGQRIRDEFARAPANKVLLIEDASYMSLVKGNYNTNFAPKAFTAKLFSMWHEYNIPIFFMPDKEYSGHFIYMYFYYYLRNLIKWGEIMNTKSKVDLLEVYLDALKTEQPNIKITIETPDGSVTCRLGDALIYQDSYGDLVIDAEWMDGWWI